jgi:hypothetical protein
MTMRFALRRLRSFGKVVVRRCFGFSFWFASAAEGGLEIEISPKIVVSRRRCALGTRGTSGTTSWTAGSLSLRTRLSPVGLRTLRAAGRLRFGSSGRGRWAGFVQQQVFRGDLCVRRWLGAKINAEQIFGESFPGVFFAARAGAQRIGVHKAFIRSSSEFCGKSEKTSTTAAIRKHKPENSRRAGRFQVGPLFTYFSPAPTVCPTEALTGSLSAVVDAGPAAARS